MALVEGEVVPFRAVEVSVVRVLQVAGNRERQSEEVVPRCPTSITSLRQKLTAGSV